MSEGEINLSDCRTRMRREYKKDSLFVFDLYTLTYDNHESLDSISARSVFIARVCFLISWITCLRNLYSVSVIVVSRLPHGTVLFLLFLNRDEMTGRKLEEDWPWMLRTIISRDLFTVINQEENPVFIPDCKVVSTLIFLIRQS